VQETHDDLLRVSVPSVSGASIEPAYRGCKRNSCCSTAFSSFSKKLLIITNESFRLSDAKNKA
jgi:hypothetical protein